MEAVVGGSEGVLMKLHWAWDVSQMFVLCGHMMSTDQVIPADKLTPCESLKQKRLRCLFSSTYRGCDCLHNTKQWKKPRRRNVHTPFLRNSMFNASPLINESLGIWLKRMKLRKKSYIFLLWGNLIHTHTHTHTHTHSLFPFQHLHLQVKRMNEVLKDALTDASISATSQ